jgi:hypothetical protein
MKFMIWVAFRFDKVQGREGTPLWPGLARCVSSLAAS